MRIDPILLLEEIDYLCNKIHSVSSLTEYSKLCLSIQNLKAVYDTLTANMEEFRFPVNVYFEEMLTKSSFDCLKMHLEQYEKEKSDHAFFSRNVLDTYSEEEFIAYRKFYNQTKLRQDRYDDILKSFLNYYNPALYSLFTNMKNGMIDIKSLKNFESNCMYFIPSLNKSYIVVDDDNSIDGISSLIHELAHAYAYSLFSSYKQSRNSDNSYYTEVFSMFSELLFIEYLKKNKILTKDAVFSENEFYRWVKGNFETLKELSTLEEETLPEEDQLIEDSLLYGYGGMISFELIENYNQDDIDTKSRIKRFLTSQGIVSSEELLNILGVSKSDMYTCKVLRKRLREHNKDIQILNKKTN